MLYEDQCEKRLADENGQHSKAHRRSPLLGNEKITDIPDFEQMGTGLFCSDFEHLGTGLFCSIFEHSGTGLFCSDFEHFKPVPICS